MPVEPTSAMRPALRLRADVPEPDRDWVAPAARPTVIALAAVFVAFGGSAMELGPGEARLGLASADPVGPFGRVFGYWDPSIWPLPVALGRIWAWFEQLGPTQAAVRWPSAIAGAVIGVILARRARLTLGPRAGVLVALAWFGSAALMDRSGGMGLDLIAGLGTVAALDRLLARGSGWSVGTWASLAFLAGGWPPLAVLALATIVLGRSGATWGWRMTVPVAATVAAWSAWALSVAPAEAWASALTLPITRPSAWGLALGTIAAGCPWAPFAALGLSRTVREGWPAPGRSLVVGWLQVAGACLIVGTVVPGLATAAMVPGLAGLAMAAGSGWDRAWADGETFPTAVRRGLLAATLAISGLWLLTVLAWGGPVAFAVAYYRSVVIAVAILSLTGLIFALAAARRGDARRALGAMVLVAVAVKLAHWGYYVPESNYRTGAGPWGRAIGQWVPEKHAVYVLHAWPADLAFAMNRPVRQLHGPQLIEFQPGKGSKFVLLQDSEYAEYQSWSEGWPKLLKVAEFEDEMGLSRRILTRTDKPLIVERPYKRSSPMAE